MVIKLFFLHNPKAGGSSLRSALHAVSDHGPMAPVFCNAPQDDRVARDSLADFEGFDFYAGHYGYDVYKRLRNGHHLVTNFRDPIQRIRSLYRFWRGDVPDDFLHGLAEEDARLIGYAKTDDFSTFIRRPDPDLHLYIRNSHFRQLYRSTWQELKRVNSLSLAIVKRRISRMRWFYIAETPEASKALFDHSFARGQSMPMPRLNPSSGDTFEVSVEDSRYIAGKNRLDYAIYAHAIREQSRRLVAIG